jgi:3-oxoacyl-[acyl-carrier-protein] synthase-3
VGRIELMTGIRERRFFPPGTRPSAVAAAAGAAAIGRSGIERGRIGTLIHASVCRDFLEPATASVVHHRLGLAATCSAFDLSNACLGVANGMALVAGAIERGEIDAGLVVAGEDGRPLVESTVASLLERPDVTRAELKLAFASLTIGSGAAAVLLTRDELAPDAPRLVAAVSGAATEHHALCAGDRSPDHDGPLMQTDSEALLHAGNALAARTWERFHDEAGWWTADVERVVTHQVGVAHRRLLMETLGIDPSIDFPTVERLGNIGSVSLPLSFSMARDEGFIGADQRVAMLGIGSGLHCLMLAVAT